MRLFQSLSFWLSALCLASLLAGWLLPVWGVISLESAVYLFLISYFSGGYYGVKEGIEELKQGKASVDLLMILAAVGAATINQWMEGAILLFLFSLSNALQEFALEKSNRAIEALMKLRPDTACVRAEDGTERQVPIEEIIVGQTVIVRPGERFPLDAIVMDGTTTVDQSAITGESIPVDKVPGNEIFAGTMNNMGAVAIKVTKPATESTLARIVEMVQRARKGKARTQRILDEFEPKYALTVILITILLILVPYSFGWGSFDEIFYRAMTILVVASPCALVISTPATILSAIAHAARKGVLFKGGGYLEQAASIQYVAMDKTGTLTKGLPEVVGVYPLDSITPDELLQQAANAERLSEHPLAAAVVRAARAKGMSLDPIVNLRAVTGKGVEVEMGTHVIRVGSRRLMDDSGIVRPEIVMQRVDELEKEGNTVIFVARDLELLGLLALADVIKAEARQAIVELRRLGIKQVVMLTGDSHRVAESVAQQLGMVDFRAELLPGNKEQIIKELAALGPVAMVGDGVNDAPALASGNLGVAMGGAGTDVALETADVVLMSDDLTRLPWLIQLSRRARAVVWQNIVFSLSVIAVLVTAVFVADLPLPLGVIGHEGSTLIVVANGLRLLGGSRITS
jgi:Cd2+/Zn2+-exporting ATPase